MKTMKDLKPFSKEWFVNYWMYYKWQTIGTIFLVLAIVLTVVEAVNKVHPDINVYIVSKYAVLEEDQVKLEDKLEKMISDINNDGKKTVDLYPLNVVEEPKDEMQIAAQQKLFLEFAAGNAYIFIMDRSLYELYDSQEVFKPINGDQKCIDLKGSSLTADTNFKDEDMVLAVRQTRNGEKSDYRTTQEVLDSVMGK